MQSYAYSKSVIAWYEFFVNLFLYPRGIRSLIFREVPIRDGDRILDAGCGYGVVSKPISEKISRDGISGTEHHAFDIAPDMLEKFRRNCSGQIHLRQLDVRNLLYPDDYFDLILTAAMLEYVPNIEEGLLSLKRVLKTGGTLYVIMSRKTILNDLLFKPFGNPRCYSPRELSSVLNRVGFANTSQSSFPPAFFWLNAWGYMLQATK